MTSSGFPPIERIQRSDLEPILAVSTGTHAFARILENITSENDLLPALSRYIYFNSVFGSGVANLAGELAARQDIFRDSSEVLETIADRSVEVAANIFFAAIDEFGDRSTTHRSTHRSLAQAMLKAASHFFRCDPEAFNDLARPNQTTLAAIRKVRDGYCINQIVDEHKIFRAIGFHIGSEILADQEFRILDGFLHAKHRDLVDYLERAEVIIGGIQHAAYLWVRIHTSVEAEHFNVAMVGANYALQYYAGSEGRARVKEWILEGSEEFALVQADFMEHLME
ncbi:MAG: hypothetical protein AABN34_22935 [Acidobacteriota bacterium]